MHVLLVTVGTTGDILPYVGLGVELKARGHEVALVASAGYGPLARRHGLGFHELVSAAENRELFDDPDFWHPFKTAPLSARWGVRFLRRQYDLLAGLRRPDTVLVASPGVFAAGLLAETHRVPWISIVLQPGILPSVLHPPRMMGFGWLTGAPRPVWRVFWRLLDGVGDRLVGPELNRLRRELGLAPRRRLFTHWLSPQRVLGMFPDWYGPVPADWPPQMRLVGFPQWTGDAPGALAPELREFCAAGPAPVAVTFGTGMVHSAALFQAALAAVHRLGARAILLTPHRGQLPAVLPGGVRHAEHAGFHQLFPLCGAVLHHGGVGTLAAALAAGTPQLVRPICFDQPDNGVRVRRLGVGDCLGAARAGGPQIAAALRPLLTPAAGDRCRAWAERAAETGACRRAADLVEQAAGSTRPG